MNKLSEYLSSLNICKEAKAWLLENSDKTNKELFKNCPNVSWLAYLFKEHIILNQNEAVEILINLANTKIDERTMTSITSAKKWLANPTQENLKLCEKYLKDVKAKAFDIADILLFVIVKENINLGDNIYFASTLLPETERTNINLLTTPFKNFKTIEERLLQNKPF